jgi:hypothetical protein
MRSQYPIWDIPNQRLRSRTLNREAVVGARCRRTPSGSAPLGTRLDVDDHRAMLEIYDRDGALVRSVAMVRDERDATKWHLAESVVLNGHGAERGVIRFGDGTSEPLAGSLSGSAAPMNTLFL